MNIPTGKPIIKAVPIKNLNYLNMLADLLTKKFNGYVCLTIKDKYGFEDSFLVFEEGIIKGAYHSFINKNKDNFGDNAIKLFIGALTSKFGTIDVYALSKEQTELILTFNERIKNEPVKDIKFLNQYSNSKYRDEIMGINNEKSEETKYDLFKKIGLGNISI